MSQTFFIDKNNKFIHSYTEKQIKKTTENSTDPFTRLLILEKIKIIADTWEHDEIRTRLRILAKQYAENQTRGNYFHKEIGIPRTSLLRFIDFFLEYSKSPRKDPYIDEKYIDKIKEYLLIYDLEFKEKSKTYIAKIDILKAEKSVLTDGIYNYSID